MKPHAYLRYREQITTAPQAPDAALVYKFEYLPLPLMKDLHLCIWSKKGHLRKKGKTDTNTPPLPSLQLSEQQEVLAYFLP